MDFGWLDLGGLDLFVRLLTSLICYGACVRVCLFFLIFFIKSREEEGKKKGVENLDRDLFGKRRLGNTLILSISYD